MGADAAPTPRQWQGHSHRALRAGLAHIRKGGGCIWGLASPPCPHVNAGRLIPNCALTGIKLAHIFCEKAEQNIFFSLLFSCAVRRNWGCNIPCCRGAWGEQPHKSKPPHSKISALFSKRNRFCFIKQFPPGFMPIRASFGIKRPAFTWGCGGGASPRKCVRKSSYLAA